MHIASWVRPALAFSLALVVGCENSAHRAQLSVQLIGAWRAEVELSDTRHTVVRYVVQFRPDGHFRIDFKSIDESGLVEDSWETGRWQIVGEDIIRNEALDSTDGKPKSHDRVIDYRILELTESRLRYKGLAPNAVEFLHQRVGVDARP